MTGWWEIAAIASATQLAVLPGEKVQFIIAGLASRYHPLLVVGAAGTAFAGWTAVEIAFGEAVRGALPGVYLDLIAAGLFLLFAVMLFRSAPADAANAQEAPSPTDAARTDGGIAALDRRTTVLGREVPGVLGDFLPIFSLMAVGEFGDKTQLVTIGLAIEYGATSAIWVGEMAAIIPVSLVNAYFFHRFSHRIDRRRAHYVGAALFAFFGLDTLLSVTTGVSVWETVVTALADLPHVLV